MDENLLRRLTKNLKIQEQILIQLLYLYNISVLDLLSINLLDIIIIKNLNNSALIILNKDLRVICGITFDLLSQFISKRYQNEYFNYDSAPLFLGKQGRLSLNEFWIITRKFSDLVSSTFNDDTSANPTLPNATIMEVNKIYLNNYP